MPIAKKNDIPQDFLNQMRSNLTKDPVPVEEEPRQSSTEAAEPLTSKVVPEVQSQVQIARSELKPSTIAAQPVQESKSEDKEEKKKRVLIGIYVTPEEQAELRQMFCSNGFSLSNAYRSAMTYLRQDIEQGKAFITKNSEILRK